MAMAPTAPTGMMSEDEARQAAEAEAQLQKDASAAFASLIQSGFAAAHNQRLSQPSGKAALSERIQDCRRNRDGEYSDKKLAAIRALKGNEILLNLTEPKCSALVAWVNRIVREKFFLVEPTVEADLPPEALDEIARETLEKAMDDLSAGLLSEDQLRGAVVALATSLEKARKKSISAEARERAEGMQEKIEDQLSEGRFAAAWGDFLEYLATYPFAILKGPIIQVERKAKWEGGRRVFTDEPVMSFSAVHPDDFFPGPNVTDLDHGDLYETCKLDPADLEAYAQAARAQRARREEVQALFDAGEVSQELLDAALYPEWNPEEIEAVLSGPAPTSIRDCLPESLERARTEGSDTAVNQGVAEGLLTGVWCWRTVKREDLTSWGARWAANHPRRFIDCRLLLVGTHVVCANPNRDPYLRRPYSIMSFKRIPGQLVGEGLPEILAPAQQGYAAAVRNAVDNAAFSSRPCGSFDWRSLNPACKPAEVLPGKIYDYDGNLLQQRPAGIKPIEFFDIPSNTEKFLRLAEFFKNEADNASRIPVFAYGNGDVEGAGQTMGGLSMLMNSAAMGIEQLIVNIDTYVIARLISMVFDWDVEFLPDDQYGAIKGDCRVVARGALALMIQNAADEKLPEMIAQASKDPNIFALIGFEGLARLLREMYRRFNIPGMEVVPDEDEIKQRLGPAGEPLAMAQAQLGMGAPPPPGAPGQPAQQEVAPDAAAA